MFDLHALIENKNGQSLTSGQSSPEGSKLEAILLTHMREASAKAASLKVTSSLAQTPVTSG